MLPAIGNDYTIIKAHLSGAKNLVSYMMQKAASMDLSVRDAVKVAGPKTKEDVDRYLEIKRGIEGG